MFIASGTRLMARFLIYYPPCRIIESMKLHFLCTSKFKQVICFVDHQAKPPHNNNNDGDEEAGTGGMI